jgi:hypothetical protein
VQPNPIIYLWMHDQELQRTMRQNALERLAKEAQPPREGFPIRIFRVNRIKSGLSALRRTIRPAGTGAA